ncbi:hypothetical protein Plhal304r1_c022g0077141 [Plasmopara halstedii]
MVAQILGSRSGHSHQFSQNVIYCMHFNCLLTINEQWFVGAGNDRSFECCIGKHDCCFASG